MIRTSKSQKSWTSWGTLHPNHFLIGYKVRKTSRYYTSFNSGFFYLAGFFTGFRSNGKNSSDYLKVFRSCWSSLNWNLKKSEYCLYVVAKSKYEVKEIILSLSANKQILFNFKRNDTSLKNLVLNIFLTTYSNLQVVHPDPWAIGSNLPAAWARSWWRRWVTSWALDSESVRKDE